MHRNSAQDEKEAIYFNLLKAYLQKNCGSHFLKLKKVKDSIQIHTADNTDSKYLVRDTIVKNALKIPVENLPGEYSFYVKVADLFNCPELDKGIDPEIKLDSSVPSIIDEESLDTPQIRGFVTNITLKLKQLGYIAAGTQPLGVCNGLTYMWMQAKLAKDLGHFYERLRIIHQADDLASLIGQAQEKAKQKVDLTSAEQCLLEVPAFLQNLLTYQNPALLLALNKELVQTEVEAISYFTLSKILENKGGINEIFNCELKDKTMEEYQHYFDNLREILRTSQPDSSIVISTRNHKIGIEYDSKNECWEIFDQNCLNFQNPSPVKVVAPKKIGQEMMDLFKSTKMDNRLMTRIYESQAELKLRPDLLTIFSKLKTPAATQGLLEKASTSQGKINALPQQIVEVKEKSAHNTANILTPSVIKEIYKNNGGSWMATYSLFKNKDATAEDIIKALRTRAAGKSNGASSKTLAELEKSYPVLKKH